MPNSPFATRPEEKRAHHAATRSGIPALVFLTWTGLAPALAQASDDVVVSSHHIDVVRDAKNPGDVVKQCLDDPGCAVLANTIAAQIGIPGNAVRVISLGAAYTAKAEGEETRYTIPAAPGRKVCSVKVRTTSVVPATGDRASLFSISARPEQVGIYTWTPVQGMGQGRSWYEGDVVITHVKNSLHAEYLKGGKCTVQPGATSSYDCRGASGVNNGKPACGSKDL